MVVQPARLPSRCSRHHPTRSIGPCSPSSAVTPCPARPRDQDHADRRDAARRIGPPSAAKGDTLAPSRGGPRRGGVVRARGRRPRRDRVGVGAGRAVVRPARPERPRQARVRAADDRLRPRPARSSSDGSSDERPARRRLSPTSRTLVLDATTTAEDRTFWDNGGVRRCRHHLGRGRERDAASRERGASTITQQLVRARLLPPRTS